MSSTSNIDHHNPMNPSAASHRSSTSLTPTASSTHTEDGVQTKTENLRMLAHKVKIALKDPVNMFKAAMLFIIIVGGAIIFLLLVGWVKLSDDAQKVLWIEIFSQILNAIFTLSAVIPQPLRLRSIVRAAKLECLSRKIAKSDKNEGRTLEEAGVARMDNESKMNQTWSKVALDFPWMVKHGKGELVVPRITPRKLLLISSLLNLHSVTQYIITIAMWGWPPSTRPGLMVFPMIPISFLSNMVGGILLGRNEAKANQAAKREIIAPTEEKA